MDGFSITWQNFVLLIAVYFTTRTFYRLFLHPLARFPGPKLAAVTRCYEAYYDIVQNGQYTSKIAQLHKKYGPIIRISPYELHVIDPGFYEKLYRQDGRWDKYAWAYNAFTADGATITTAPHDLHRARRQPLNQFFSKTRVSAHRDIIDRNIAIFSDRVTRFNGKVFDLGAAISALTRDVACAFMLNKTYASLEREDFNVDITNMLHQGGSIWRITKHFPWFGPAMHAIPPGLLYRLVDDGTRAFLSYVKQSEQDTKDLLRIANNVASNNDSESSESRTVVHEIVDSKLPLAEKRFERVMNDVATITGAGFETTASVLRLILYHVFSHPELLRRLRAELASVGDKGRIEIKTLEQLPLLTAVIMEGMRLSPAIGSRSARIAPDRDLFYGEMCIPAGTPVGMTTILMHTDANIYPEPLSFNPDRWMDPETRNKLDKTYAPFSRGTRICLGMYLAWAEMYLIIAHVVPLFDFEFQDVDATHFEMVSDQFIIGTKGNAKLNARAISKR